MVANEDTKFAVSLLEMVNKKKEEIGKLTNEIIEWEDDPKNIKKIKQSVLSILNAVTFCTDSKSYDLHLVTLSADMVFDVLRPFSNPDDPDEVEPDSFGLVITHQIEDFCNYANSWNPIKYDFTEKGWKIEFKNLNIGIIQNK